MKKCISVLVAVLLVMAVSGCSSEEQVQLADGSAVPRSAWDGQWLVINYWAEWCAPCREEIPHLNDLHANGDEAGVVVLGVNYDALQPPKLNEVMERMDVRFPVLLQDPRLEYGFERAQQLPVTVLINPAREVHDILLGPQTEDSILAALN